MVGATNNTTFYSSCNDLDDFENEAKIVYVSPFHISNIISIVTNQRLHQKVYLLLLNLTVSDILTIMCFFLLAAGVSPSIYMPIVRNFYTTSILFTCAMTLDRYLKVKYPLRYFTIFTTCLLYTSPRPRDS